jgi:hypothetical protein
MMQGKKGREDVEETGGHAKMRWQPVVPPRIAKDVVDESAPFSQVRGELLSYARES